MNLSQIERKFRQLEIKENFHRYFFNPACPKIVGLKQHAYISELEKDQQHDITIYGMDPFIKANMKVNNNASQYDPNQSSPQRTVNQTPLNVDTEYDSRYLESPGRPLDINSQLKRTHFKTPNRECQINYGITSGGGRPKSNAIATRFNKYEKHYYGAKPKNIINQCDKDLKFYLQQKQRKKVTISQFEQVKTDLNQRNHLSYEQLIYLRLNDLSEEERQKPKSKNDIRKHQIEDHSYRDDTSVNVQIHLDEDQSTVHDERLGPARHYKIENNIEQVDYRPIKPMLFNLKITDLSDLENPFVLFEKRPIDFDGFLILDNMNKSVLNPLKIFPWLNNLKDIEKRTLKIEVTFDEELILLRFIHLDIFYPIKYPQTMLEIMNNIHQNQVLLERQNFIGNNDLSQGVLIMKKIDYTQENKVGSTLQKSSIQTNSQSSLEENEVNKSLPQAQPSNIGVDIYYSLKPYRNKIFTLLEDVKNYRLHLKDLPKEFEKRDIDVNPSHFKDLKIIIEYNDCILQSNSLIEYNILRDDNIERFNNQQRVEEAKRISMAFNQRGKRQAQLPLLQGQGLMDANIGSRAKSMIIQGRKEKTESLFSKFGQNKETQYFVRKEREEQAKKNRKNMQMLIPQAAITMKDNRRVFKYLNNTSLIARPVNFGITGYGAQSEMAMAPQSNQNQNNQQKGFEFPEQFSCIISTKGEYTKLVKDFTEKQQEVVNLPPPSRSEMRSVGMNNTHHSFLYRPGRKIPVEDPYYQAVQLQSRGSTAYYQGGRPMSMEKDYSDLSSRYYQQNSMKNTMTHFDRRSSGQGRRGTNSSQNK